MFKITIAPPLSAGFMVMLLFFASSLIDLLSLSVMFRFLFLLCFSLLRSISLRLMNVSKLAEACGGFQLDFCLNFRKFAVLPYGLILSSILL